MSKIESNIAELRKIINENNFKLEEANEFLDAIEQNVTDLNDEITSLEEDNSSKDSEISELRDEVNELEGTELTNKIDCGIGDIEFNEPDNLLLQNVMENLESAIKKTTPKKVNELLETLI